MKEKIKSFATRMESEYPGLVLELTYLSDRDAIKVESVIVPKGERKQGTGTEVMKDLAGFADDNNLWIYLEPSTDFGATSVARLQKFYARFGFFRNKGSKKDFRFYAGMLRKPGAKIKAALVAVLKSL